jgi:hypothetical protein
MATRGRRKVPLGNLVENQKIRSQCLATVRAQKNQQQVEAKGAREVVGVAVEVTEVTKKELPQTRDHQRVKPRKQNRRRR